MILVWFWFRSSLDRFAAAGKGNFAAAQQMRAQGNTLHAGEVQRLDPAIAPERRLKSRRSGASNPENPDRDDGSQHGQAGNRPARRITGTFGFRPVHHRIMPMGHNRLLAIASGG